MELNPDKVDHSALHREETKDEVLQQHTGLTEDMENLSLDGATNNEETLDSTSQSSKNKKKKAAAKKKPAVG